MKKRDDPLDDLDSDDDDWIKKLIKYQLLFIL